jgi:hypothetical protein
MRNEEHAVRIRNTTDSDREAIQSVHKRAFGDAEGPEIADLVSRLLDDGTALPLLSLAAEMDGQMVGHVLFTAVRLEPDHQSVSARILAPLGVVKEHQRQGIGGSLINAGLKQLEASGVELVFVLGHPDYYPKFGFRPAGAPGFEAPYPIPDEHRDAWMVHELKPGVIGRVKGEVRCAKVLDRPQYWLE